MDEGISGFQRAIHACMLKVAVASAVQLSTYDLAKARLEESHAWRQHTHPAMTHVSASVAASFCVVSVINPMEVRAHMYLMIEYLHSATLL